MSFWRTWLPFGYIRSSPAKRTAALMTPTIEELTNVDAAVTLISDGKQTKGALPLASDRFDGAVYSSRGRGYARHNEDAGSLLRDASGRMYAMALDQAGGLGGRIRGRASALVAEELITSCRSFALDHVDETDPTEPLLEGFLRSHKLLLDRNEGEVTTAVVAILQPKHVYLVNSGDSGAIHYNRNGELKNETLMQEYPPPNEGCLVHALGLEPEGCEPTPYVWALEAGDWIVLGSDGLLDSGMIENELGKVLAEVETAEDAVNRICTIVLRRMGSLRAKPDNLTVVIVRVRPEIL